MKKLLTLALLTAFAGVASAASIDWRINVGRNGLVADSSGNATSGPVYLLLANDAASLAAAVEADTFASTLSDLALDSVELTSAGKWNGSGDKTATSNKLTANQSYDFAIVVYDSAANQYYVSATKTQQAYDETAENPVKKGVTYQATEIGSTYSGANWASTKPSSTPDPQPDVPEPATGALALAGVALLFKRRRA